MHTIKDIIELHQVLESATRPVALVIGAGASFPLPAAVRVKEEVLRTVYALADVPLSKERLDALLDRRHLTLEHLFSLCEQSLDPLGTSCHFRGEDIMSGMLQPRHGARTRSAGAAAVCALKKAGVIGPILTTNFDTLLYEEFQEHGIPFTLLTERQMAALPPSRQPDNADVLALHGTLYTAQDEEYTRPATIFSRGLLRPFNDQFEPYILNLLTSRTVVFFGYSGCDHYDFNLLLDRTTRGTQGRNLHWIVYAARPGTEVARATGISQFAKTLPGCAFYGGDFAGLITERYKLPAHLSAKVDERQLRTAAFFTVAPTPQLTARARDLTQHLDAAFDAACLIPEHYRLDSMGYDISAIRWLEGEDGNRLGLPHDLLTDKTPGQVAFYGVAVFLFLEIIHKYWAVPEQRATLSMPLAALSASIETALESGRLRANATHMALAYLLKAIAHNYLGLLDRNVHKNTVAAASRFATCTAMAERAEIYRRRALEGVGVTIASMGGHALFRDLLPFKIWQIAGRENGARCMEESSDASRERKCAALSECYEVRREVAAYLSEHDRPEEAQGFDMQAILRANEAIKIAYRYGELGGVSVPTPNLIARCDAILDGMGQIFDTYKAGFNNYRFITYFECRFIIAWARRGQYDNIAEEFTAYYGAMKQPHHSHINYGLYAKSFLQGSLGCHDPGVGILRDTLKTWLATV